MILPWLLAMLCLNCASAWAASLSFTVTTSKPVVVTGTPRIAIDVGGIARYATWASGSGTNSLTFSYQVQPGDFDANGIAITSPLDLSGGTITDAAGNAVSPLSFTVPDTSAVKVQTYTAAFTTSPITEASANAVSFAIAKAPAGASFTYSITSSGGAGSVTGSGTIGSNSHTVSGVNVSALPSGALTLSVTVSTTAGGTGAAHTATAMPTFSGVLDGINAGAATFSTLRMSSAQTGPLLRVRRATDNSERDIGSTVGGRLDTAALTAFCGSASCFVSRWYDQSGSGRDASQADPALQPRLVNAGTIDTVNGLPAPYFNGVDSILTAAIPIPAGNLFWSTHLVTVRGNGAGFGGRIWGMNATNPSLIATLSTDIYIGPSGTQLSTSGSTSPRIVSAEIATSSSPSTIWVNGVSRATATTGFGSFVGDSLAVGNVGNTQRALNGNLQTLYFGLGTLPTANRQAVERWLGTASGISVP